MSPQDPPSTRLAASSRQGPLRFGPYTVVSELGRGAMGVVFRARDLASGQDVALKLALQRLEGVRLKRFEREGQVTAALRHDGIVRVYAAGVADGRPYLAYELIEGARSLDAAARDAPFGRRVELVRDAARALGHAHSQGIVHRDVKPSNVLVDARGRVRVADFGLATGRLDDERLTLTGALMGTPEFMAPEQLQGRRDAVGPWSDVWAIGVMLSQALCGEHPFASQSLLELMEKVDRDDPLTPRRVDPKVPAALDAVVLRALRREPAERYPDGEALAADLDRFLEGGPMSAEEPLDARRPRGRLVALASAAVAAAALAGVALVATRPELRRPAGPAASPAAAPAVDPPRGATSAGTETPATRTMAAVADTGTNVRAQPAAASVVGERGREALHSGRFEEALELLTQAIALDPTDPRLRTTRAGALLRLRRHDEAAEEAALATELDPARVEGWVNLSTARAAQARFDEAIVAATRAIERSPRDVDGWLCRIHAHVGKRDPAATLPDCDALLAIDPDHVVGLGLRARTRFALGDPDGARADLERAIELAPENGELMALRGALAGMQGRPEDGLADMTRALELGHDDPQLRVNRSLALQSLGRLREALDEADQAVALAPERIDPWLTRAHLRLLTDDGEGAIADATRALAIDPDDWTALVNRGMALRGARQHARAIDDFTRAAAVRPDDDLAVIERGRARAGNGDHAGALQDFERGLALNPGSTVGWTQLATLRAQRGEHDLALAAYSRSIELAPEVGVTYHRRALVHLALGDVDAARADWERALTRLDRNDRLIITVREHLRTLPGGR